MNRKKFLKKGLIGMGTVIATPYGIVSNKKDKEANLSAEHDSCEVSPTEILGPFPIKSPADLVRANIVGDRRGVPLLIHVKVEDVQNHCVPLVGAFVDIWHCDAMGNYSEYSRQVQGNFTREHFLRGRQITDESGIASFITIYPGWYPGRAPHLHFEVLSRDQESLLVTQTAFPENTSAEVYATEDYNGDFDTSNTADYFFNDGDLDKNLATSVTGNITDGYVLHETLKVKT